MLLTVLIMSLGCAGTADTSCAECANNGLAGAGGAYTCAAETYVSGGTCTGLSIQDTQTCAQCLVCDASTQHQVKPCCATAACEDRQCAGCSVCGEAEYSVSGCDGVSDTLCAACTCERGSFMQDDCAGGTQAPRCTTCSNGGAVLGSWGEEHRTA